MRNNIHRIKKNNLEDNKLNFVEKVIFINRVSKVVKGGRRFSFTALVAYGDQKGSIGVGYGKANEVPDAIKKATYEAKKSIIKINLKDDTIPHEILGKSDGGFILLKPALSGTGVIAGGGARAILIVAGIKNILTKSLGSNNVLSLVKATMNGLKNLVCKEEIKEIRK